MERDVIDIKNKQEFNRLLQVMEDTSPDFMWISFDSPTKMFSIFEAYNWTNPLAIIVTTRPESRSHILSYWIGVPFEEETITVNEYINMIH